MWGMVGEQQAIRVECQEKTLTVKCVARERTNRQDGKMAKSALQTRHTAKRTRTHLLKLSLTQQCNTEVVDSLPKTT